jgi:formimidoylglutamate deiminase
MTPTAVLAQSGFFDRRRRFCAVHAIHITPEDIAMLAQQSVCACPTTEADLGDGIVRGMDLRRAGAGLALGSDSNSVIDLIQEARLLEMHERLRTRSRVCMRDEHGRVAETLLGIATAGGAAALGRGHRCGSLAVGYPFDAALFDLDHPLFAGIDPAYAVDTLVTCGTAAAVHKVFVGGVETS